MKTSSKAGEEALIAELVGALRERFGQAAEVGVVLGSGWSEGAGALLDDADEIALADLPHWPLPAVEGHGGSFAVGAIAGRRAAVCGGRVHAYEGRPARELVRGVRALVGWGVPSILLLNAAGSLREERLPGSLMPFSDHFNINLPDPNAADQAPGGNPVFLDTVNLYSPGWRERLCAARPELEPGVYMGLRGPSYETPTEVVILRGHEGEAVGMSTIPEALAARAAGSEVMAISLLTNFAAGIKGGAPSHEEVLEAARAHAGAAAEVLEAAIQSAP